MARAAGVSLATASRALNPDTNHPVRSATRERVLKAAADLAYQPNPMARGLRARRLPTIGVLVHDIGDPYFTEIVRGAAHEASKHGYLIFVGSSERDADAELRYVDMLRLSRVSAILFAGGELSAPHYRRGVQALVEEVRSYGGVVVALAPRRERWPTEITDNRGGARQMTEYLLQLGHRRIAFVGGPDYVLTSGDREAGYREAMEAAGQTPVVERSDFTIESGATATAALLDSQPGFTALFLCSDTIAIGALAELRRRRIRVPEDLSVAGFGGEPSWVHGEPGLTTVETRLEEIGAAGVQRAIAELAGRPGGRRVHAHPATILERGSTRPVRQPARR